MKFVAVLLLLGFASIFSNAQQSKNQEVTSRSPVLVELYTAEGCPNCPRAEKLLTELKSEQPVKSATIVPLVLHVDYWDKYGLVDIFASPLYTRRQMIYEKLFKYGQVYTPQMIVDGKYAFIGSRKAEALDAINRAAKVNKPRLSISADEKMLVAYFSGLPKHEEATLYLAITQDAIPSRVNSGQGTYLQTAVTRSLNAISRVSEESVSGEYQFSVDIEKKWILENLNLVVFIQENTSRKILAVESVQATSVFDPKIKGE
ncbi:MAG: DUF1223 domain-containing protein [Pyrinomonadaceae bacterium]